MGIPTIWYQNDRHWDDKVTYYQIEKILMISVFIESKKHLIASSDMSESYLIQLQTPKEEEWGMFLKNCQNKKDLSKVWEK